MIDERALIKQLELMKGGSDIVGLKQDAMIDKVISVIKKQKQVNVTSWLNQLCNTMCGEYCKKSETREFSDFDNCPLRNL